MLTKLIEMLSQWPEVFKQNRTGVRAIKQSLSLICVMGRRTISRSWLIQDKEDDWSSEYKLHSRSDWDAQKLFDPVLKEIISEVKDDYITIGIDDTRVKKTGKKIQSAHYGKDPLSPPFHINLHYGLRFLHSSVILPLYKQSEDRNQSVSARALPIRFEEVPPVRKPGKKATEEDLKKYKEEKKKRNLSTQAVASLKEMRKKVDEQGGAEKNLICVGDGSFCNKTLYRAEFERTILITRCRKDAQLCFPASGSGPKKYGDDKFTPEQVKKSEKYEWQTTTIFHSGKWRKIEYKEVNNVLWQRGGGERRLRLLVIREIPYRKNKKGSVSSRQPGYLLTTETKLKAEKLLQKYFDRWQVEVVHRDLKETFGLGEAQVRAAASVPRQPVMVAATYSIMHLAALKTFGPGRPEEFGSLPKYQREKKRPSCADMIRYLRNEIVTQASTLPYDLNITWDSIHNAATR